MKVQKGHAFAAGQPKTQQRENTNMKASDIRTLLRTLDDQLAKLPAPHAEVAVIDPASGEEIDLALTLVAPTPDTYLLQVG